MSVKLEVLGILLVAMTMLLSACSSDESEAQTVTTGVEASVGKQVQLMLYTSYFQDYRANHRAAPTSFSAYTPDKVTDMGFYMIKGEDETPYKEKRLRYATKWFAYFNAEALKNYTVYGYMPKTEGMSSSLTSESEGVATLTINGMKPVTADDICIITGVKDTDTGLREGQFGWYMANANDNFYMYLLMDHLYASVNFSLMTHVDYALLRTIKLKTMTLIVDKSSVNATVTLTHNSEGESPITEATYTSDGSSCEAQIFNDAEGVDLSSSTPIEVSACYAPALSNNLTLVSTYDVYDSQGNLIRKGCTSTNKLPALNAKRAERVQINMTVNPTYLYVLSHKDLDNLFVIE